MAMVTSEVALRDSATMAVASGRFLTEEEAAGNSPAVVVSTDLARALSADSTAASIVGDSIQLGNATAVVVGVLEARPASTVRRVASRRNQGDYRVYAPLEFAPGAVSMRLAPPGIMVLSSTVEQTTELRQRIEQSLAAQDTAWKKHYAITTNESRLEQISRGILMFKLFMGAITGISLLVGGIGIMNVLLSSVTERTREIGIRKATGARDNDILNQFLAESVAISAVGSGIGLALGLAGAFGITAGIRRFSQAPFLSASVSWSTLVVAALAAILIGLTFGTYPARRAARLSPIDAIRHE
jgi:putative ABC transport system permease protein